MPGRTQEVDVWCDNQHEAVKMFFSHSTALAGDSIFKCGLCHSEKVVKESALTGELKIEWKRRTRQKP